MVLSLSGHLLPGVDVGVDVLEDGLQHGVVAHAQVLDLDLSRLGPVFRDLVGVWEHQREREREGDMEGETWRERVHGERGRERGTWRERRGGRGYMEREGES